MKSNIPMKPKSRISGRLILFSFLLLTLFVLFNLLSSTSRLSVIVDMSSKMKSDMLSVLNDAFSELNEHSINGSFSYRKFVSKQNLLKDFESWKHKHGISNKSMNLSVEKLEQTVKELTPIPTTPMSLPTLDIFGNLFNSTVKQRQQYCDKCFEHNFNYIIQNDDICKIYDGEIIDLLVLVLTIHPNNRARNSIRETWLSPSKKNTKNIRYVFLLGEIKDPNMRKLILEENELYHDIVKEDFVDSYKNLTYKTMMGFKWAATKCAHARYVMKTDDDMFVNIPNLLKVFDRLGPEKMEKTVVGACSKRASPIRNRKSKWFASNESYPQKSYPGFCSGTGYATSMNVVKNVYKISPNVPFFHLEDVYVSLCINKLNFTLQGTPGFNAGRPKIDPCYYKGERMITAHQLSPSMLKIVWIRSCRHIHPQNNIPNPQVKHVA